MFEEIFFRLCQLFASFILVESVASACHPGSLNSENKVIVVLAVEERHEPLLPLKRLVDEQVLLIMPHRITKVDIMSLL